MKKQKLFFILLIFIFILFYTSSVFGAIGGSFVNKEDFELNLENSNYPNLLSTTLGQLGYDNEHEGYGFTYNAYFSNGCESNTFYLPEDMYKHSTWLVQACGVGRLYYIKVLSGNTVYYTFGETGVSQAKPCQISTSKNSTNVGNLEYYLYDFETNTWSLDVSPSKTFTYTNDQGERVQCKSPSFFDPINCLCYTEGLNFNCCYYHSTYSQWGSIDFGNYLNYSIINYKVLSYDSNGFFYMYLGDFFQTSDTYTKSTNISHKAPLFRITIDVKKDNSYLHTYYQDLSFYYVADTYESKYIKFNILNVIKDLYTYNDGSTYNLEISIAGALTVTNGNTIKISRNYSYACGYKLDYCEGSINNLKFNVDSSGNKGEGSETGGSGGSGGEDTKPNIIDTITGFISNFFDKLSEFFVGIFVPKSNYFGDVYNEIAESLNAKIPYQDYISSLSKYTDISEDTGNSIDLAVDLNNYSLGTTTISVSKFINFGIFSNLREKWYVWIRVFMYTSLIIFNIRSVIRIINSNSDIGGQVSREIYK